MTPSEWGRAREIEEKYKDLGVQGVGRAERRIVNDSVDNGYVDQYGRPDVCSYLNDYADLNPVAPQEGKSFAFWSFSSSPDSETPPVESHFQAKACAESRGYVVLSDTPEGGRLDSYRLFDSAVKNRVAVSAGTSVSKIEDARNQAWSDLSKSFVDASSGEVKVFAPDVHPNSILGKDELPELISRPDIGPERIKFVTEMPEHPHLPESIDGFLARDEVRCQVTMDHYAPDGPGEDTLRSQGLPPGTPPPHALAHKLEQIDLPPELQAQQDSAVERLRGVDSYSELRGATTGSSLDRASPVSERGDVVPGKGGPGVGAGPGSGEGTTSGLPPVSKAVPSVGNLAHSGHARSGSVERRGHESSSPGGSRPGADHQEASARPRTGHRGRSGKGPERGD